MYAETKLLEFDKIKEIVKDFAHTKVGKQKVMQLEPSINSLVIHRQLNETHQAKVIVDNYNEPPFGGVRDVTDVLKQIRIFSTLTPKDFLDIVGLVDASNNMLRFFEQVTENELNWDQFEPYVAQISSVRVVKEGIMQVITIDGKIRDNASGELSRIRRNLALNERKISEVLNQFIHTKKSKLTESLITIRGNRFVVPVKASEKNNVKGAVVDVSSSGETIYIEPDSVAQINNKVSLLKIEEHNEIERLLRELTHFVGGHHQTLKTNFDVLTTIDMLFAVGKYAQAFRCEKPVITEDEIDLKKARHPLIDDEVVVANTISFEKGEDTIIITGPNTGGKTVTLKTMGLLSIMVQSGILIPVEFGSKTIIFDNIFADIGDEQSIEQSLSTFSSHLTRIIKILENCTEKSLILFDELGSGTDPKEGSSLAMSILDYIKQFNAYVIATTHYPELKAYAYDKDHIINASVEFDVNTLSPTYRLLLGTPGKSNALLISERLGLPQSIINAAKDNVITSNTEISDLINKLEKQGNALDKKMQEYDALIKESKTLIDENRSLRRELADKQRDLTKKSNREKQVLLRDAKQEAESLIKKIEELQKQKEIKPHQLADLKHEVSELTSEEVRLSNSKYQYAVGDLVNVLKFNRNGELLEKLKNGQWSVKMGTLTMNLSAKEFEFLEGKKKTVEKAVKVKTPKRKYVSSECDLRGLRVEDAQFKLDKYIDDCQLANVPFATIIHGFGTLALRKMVKEYAAKHPSIISHRDGKGNEGGQGVTVVGIKGN